MERKKFEAREKIIKSKSFYKFRVGFFSRKKSIEDSISILSVEKAKKINEFNRKKSMTDWALVNGVWKNNTVKAKTGKYSGYYYIQGTDSDYEQFIDTSGDILGGKASNKTMNGVAVTLNLQLPKKCDQGSLNNFNYGEMKATSKEFYSLGMYPKNVVGEKAEDLEKLYNHGNILEGLESTGRWITVNGANKNQTGFFVKYCPEFVYQGERYVRTRVYEMKEVDRLGMSMRFSNGKPMPKTNQFLSKLETGMKCLSI